MGNGQSTWSYVRRVHVWCWRSSGVALPARRWALDWSTHGIRWTPLSFPPLASRMIFSLSWKLSIFTMTGLGISQSFGRCVGERWALSMICNVGKFSRPSSEGIYWVINRLRHSPGFPPPEGSSGEVGSPYHPSTPGERYCLFRELSLSVWGRQYYSHLCWLSSLSALLELPGCWEVCMLARLIWIISTLELKWVSISALLFTMVSIKFWSVNVSFTGPSMFAKSSAIK